MTVPWIGEDNSREAEGGRLLGLCGCPPAGCRVCRLVVFGTDAFRDSAAFGFPVLRAGMTAPSASLPSSVHRGSRLRLHGALRLAVVTAVSRLSWCLRLDMERTARLAMGPSRVGSANSTRSVHLCVGREPFTRWIGSPCHDLYPDSCRSFRSMARCCGCTPSGSPSRSVAPALRNESSGRSHPTADRSPRWCRRHRLSGRWSRPDRTGSCLVDGQLAALPVGGVELANGFAREGLVGELDEAKPARAAGVPVGDYSGRSDGSVVSEQ